MRKVAALPPICISATGDSPQALVDSARRALEYSRFVELRLDWLPSPAQALPLIPHLLQSDPLSRGRKKAILQATCRRQANGGRFAGTVATQMETLQRAAGAGCRLLDLEIESAEAAGAEAVEALRHQALLILSWHDFHSTPRLEAAARRLRRFPADFYKLVTTATRQTDNCAALDFLSSATRKEADGPDRKEWIVFCMEQAGIPSRVLALSRGSAFVYASCPGNREQGIGKRSQESGVRSQESESEPRPQGSGSAQGTENSAQETGHREQEPAAPGQIDYETLRNVYRAEKLTPQTALYGLLGYPVGHSLGAAIHNAAFRARGLDAVYLPLLATDLKDFRKAGDRYPLAGFSVTIPHKQKILRLVDRIDRIVRSAGAANTVRVRRGRWEAINTDVEGIIVPLRQAFRVSEGESLGKDFRAVIVGTGGAARAAFVALKELRCRDIAITGRNPPKAQGLARDLGGRPLPVAILEKEHFDLMVHATSVGMWPQKEQCFLRPEQVNADVVFDLVYNPAETRFLQVARERGCQTISGLDMFLAQAARQFEYWTGLEPPRRLMRKTAERELARFA